MRNPVRCRRSRSKQALLLCCLEALSADMFRPPEVGVPDDSSHPTESVCSRGTPFSSSSRRSRPMSTHLPPTARRGVANRVEMRLIQALPGRVSRRWDELPQCFSFFYFSKCTPACIVSLRMYLSTATLRVGDSCSCSRSWPCSRRHEQRQQPRRSGAVDVFQASGGS